MTDTTGWAELEEVIGELIAQVTIHGGVRTSDIEGINNVVLSMLATQKREIREKVEAIHTELHNGRMESAYKLASEFLLDESSSL